MNVPHAAQIARLERTRNLRDPAAKPEVVWLITSLTAEQADAARLLELSRAYWGIENGGHGRLDGSAFAPSVSRYLSGRVRFESTKS